MAQRTPRHALLDVVRLDRTDTAILTIQLGVSHDAEHVGIQDRMNNQQVQWIELVVSKKLTDRTKHVSQRVARDGSGKVRSGVVFQTIPRCQTVTGPAPYWGGRTLEHPYHDGDHRRSIRGKQHDNENR